MAKVKKEEKNLLHQLQNKVEQLEENQRALVEFLNDTRCFVHNGKVYTKGTYR